MKIKTPQLSYHTNDEGKNVRILSLCILPGGILATAGADNQVKFWRQSSNDELDYLFGLSDHFKAVNIIRFNTSNNLLATGSDDQLIHLYYPNLESKAWRDVSESRQLSKVTLRGHASDIYALSFNKKGNLMISSALDSTTILWKVEASGTEVAVKFVDTFRDHSHFIQGSCFDPYGQVFVTQGSDRSIKIYRKKLQKVKQLIAIQDEIPSDNSIINFIDTPATGYTYQYDVSKRAYVTETQLIADVPGMVSIEHLENECEGDSEKLRKRYSMFVDDSLPTFFRKPAFTLDAQHLFVPAGVYKQDSDDEGVPCVYIFHRRNFQQPMSCLKGFSKHAIAVSFCPLLFVTEGASWLNEKSLVGELFAIVTLNAIYVYCTGTKQPKPLVAVENLHLAQLTDCIWKVSKDNKRLEIVISSSDGYLSFLDLDIVEDIKMKLLEKEKYPLLVEHEFTEGKILLEKFGKTALVEAYKQKSTKRRLKKPVPEARGLDRESSPPSAKVHSAAKARLKRVQPTLLDSVTKNEKQVMTEVSHGAKKRRIILEGPTHIEQSSAQSN